MAEEEDSGKEEELTKEVEEERNINKELDDSDNEQPEKIKQEEKDASKLKIKPTPDAVKQESAIESASSKSKLEEDVKRWKSSLMRLTQLSGAVPINDEDYLINREHYTLNRDCEFATGHHSKLFKCKKEGVEQILKITPLKHINLKYKENLLKNAVLIMRYLIENGHPSLVQHLAFFQSPTKMYIFMEQLGPVNLHTFAKKNRKPNSSTYSIKVKKYCKDVAEGLNHLCVLGIAHLNVKSVNVCLTADQSSAKIVGFNNSMFVFNPYKQELVLAPKETEWSYIHAPETSKGPYKCHPADVWAFGILLVYMLTGKPPFPKKMHKVDTRLKAHLHRHFVQPEQTLLNLLMKCFEKDVQKRIDIARVLLHPYFN